MDIFKLFLAPLLVFLVAGCGGSSGGGGAAAPIDPGSTDGDSMEMVDPPAGDPLSAANCAVNLDDVATNIAVVLSNSASECDYYAEDDVRFTSALTIEPGTTILMASDTSFTVRDGSINAVGTAELPIRILGEDRAQGYWSGMKLRDLRASRLEYVQISDGGNNTFPSSPQRDGSAGLLVSGTSEIAIENVTVSNSFNEGIRLVTAQMDLTAFSDNRFHSNALEGAVIGNEIFSLLDLSNDFSGGDQPNGIQAIRIADIFDSYESLSVPAGETVDILDIGVAYHLDSIDVDGELTVNPGVVLGLIWGADIGKDGTLRLAGANDNPVLVTAVDSNEPFARINVVGKLEAQFSTVELGGDENSGPASSEPLDRRNGMIELPDLFQGPDSGTETRLDLDNVTLQNSSGWAVSCGGIAPESILTNNVAFLENEFGSFSVDCGQ